MAVKLIVRAPGSPERVALLRLLGLSESEYKQYWMAQVIRGEADSEPFVVPSFGIVKEAIRVFPGAISFIAVQDLPGLSDLKIVRIDGRAPGEPGYPLH